MFVANPRCIPGRFANSQDCVRCELCVNHVPEVFALDSHGKAYIKMQPKNKVELSLVLQCVETCPISGIRDLE